MEKRVERKMLGARVEVRLIKALKFLALEVDRPVYDLIEEAIRDLLRKYGRGEGLLGVFQAEKT